jgi:hypothetical protein
MLEAARARFATNPAVDVREWDLGEPVDSRGSFDVIVSGFAIHHYLDDETADHNINASSSQACASACHSSYEVPDTPTSRHASDRLSSSSSSVSTHTRR